MAADNQLALNLVIQALDLASGQINSVTGEVSTLFDALSKNQFQIAGDAAKQFSDNVNSATEPLDKAAKKTLALGSALTAISGTLAGIAYNEAKNFESAVADLGKVVEGGREEAQKYSEQLDLLANKYAQNGQNLLASMSSFIQAGYTAKEAFDLVEQSIKLMIAGDEEASIASNQLVSILKGFNAPASDASRAVDLLNEVSNKYATDVKQLADGMAKISPIAKAMGFSFEETAALLTPIIEVFSSGAEAADGLKTGLQKLIDPTKEVQSTLFQLGISQTTANGTLKSGKQILEEVGKAFASLDSSQKTFFTGQLVGIDQAARMALVFDGINKSSEIAAAAMNSQGSAASEVANRLNTAEAAGKRAEEQFRQLAVTIGTKYRDEIAGVISSTGDLANAFDKAVKSGSLNLLFDALKPQVKSIQDLFSSMANNVEEAMKGVNFSPLVSAISQLSGELGDAVRELTDGFDLNTIEGLKALFQALSNQLANFLQYLAGVVDGLEPFMGALNSVFSLLAKDQSTIANFAGQITGLGATINNVGPFILNLAGSMFSLVGNISSLVFQIGLCVAAFKLLSAAGIPVGTALGSLLALIGRLSPAAAGLAATIAGMPGIFLALVPAMASVGYGLGTLINNFITLVGSLVTGTNGYGLGQALADLVDSFTGLNEKIASSGTEAERAAAKANLLAAEQKKLKDEQDALNKAKQDEIDRSEAQRKANQDLIDKNIEQIDTNKRLGESLSGNGLIWDETTGKIIKAGAAIGAQIEEQRKLIPAFEELGLSASNLGNVVTEEGAKIITAFNQVLENTQATAPQIQQAFLAAVNKSATQAELDQLKQAYAQWASETQQPISQIALAFESVTNKAKQLEIEASPVGQALKTLGIDANQALTGMDAGFQNIILSIKTLASESGLAKEVITEALNKAIDTSNAKNEIDSLTKLVKELESQSKITKDSASLMLAELASKATKLGQEIDPVVEAFKKLGLTSKQELQAAANEAVKAFDVIKNSGASVSEVNKAFIAMEEKILAAAEASGQLSIETELAKLKAVTAHGEHKKAIDGLISKYDDLSKTVSKSSDEMNRDIENVSDSIKDQGVAIDGLSSKIGELENSLEGVSVATVRVGGQLVTAFGDRNVSIFNTAIKDVDKWLSEAAATAEELSDAVSNNSASLQDLVNKAGILADKYNEAVGYNDDLIESTKDSLVSAINSAKAAMTEFAETQKDALTEAKEELEDLLAVGNEVTQAQLKYKRDLENINIRIAEAEKSSNKEAISYLNEEKKIKTEIYEITVDRLKAEKEATEKTESTTEAEQALVNLSNVDFSKLEGGLSKVKELLDSIALSGNSASLALSKVGEAL